ncbi:serine/arginine repetitive matrix protein 2 [Streptomyces fragilis]|uniref:Serine/arginine repetitive matrix protein 2 n=1 Tax=Streptomyces fragilis TaxID=67301 RepID=A0ABV2YIF4_9ACTN|nr:serine/arginine repetitive matrix protein 2 [Streptomyces fragilis]
MAPGGAGVRGEQLWDEDGQRWADAGGGVGRAVPPAPPVPSAPPAFLPSPAVADGGGHGSLPEAPGAPSASVPTPPPVGPATVTGGAGGGRRRLPRVTVPLLAAGALAGAAVGWWLIGGGDTERPSAPPGTAAPAPEPTGEGGVDPAGTASAVPSEDPGASASASEPALPDGYRLAEDPAGFTLAVPEDWIREKREHGVFYTPGTDRSLVQVFEVTEPGMTPLESLEITSDSLDSQPGFEQISLEETGPVEGASDAVGSDAAELVYAYDSEELGIRKQVVDCVFTADDGRMYAVLVAGPADEWPVQEEQLAVALDHFTVD